MPKFLIVDDDPVSQQSLQDMLSPHGQCDLVAGGKEAIDAVGTALDDGAPYDLVCLDILMPHISGHDALLGIRRVEADYGLAGSDGVKVIMTTAVRDSQHCLQAFREGCESYMAKPINPIELLQQMYALGVLERESFDKTPSTSDAS